MYLLYRSIFRRIDVMYRFKGADGLPWWSPSQVRATVVCAMLICVRAWYCFVWYLLYQSILVTRQFLPVITADISTGHRKFCNYVTQTIINSSVPEIRNFSNSSHPLFVIVATHLPTSKDGSLSFGYLFRKLNLGPPARSCTNEHARTLLECWRFN